MNIHVRITREENAKYFNTYVGDIVAVDFEQYVAAVVASEIGNSSLTACEAQAVASRTFAYRYIDSSISDSSSSAQAYRAARYDKKKYPNAIAATSLTQGEILCYKGNPISAVFSASNGGRTVSSKQRWGTNFPYLIEKEDPWDSGNKTGHGVGMSQRGIKVAAAWNVNYKDILAFYYPNTQLRKNYGKGIEVPKFLLDQIAKNANEVMTYQHLYFE